jgi:hypothetical protein
MAEPTRRQKAHSLAEGVCGLGWFPEGYSAQARCIHRAGCRLTAIRVSTAPPEPTANSTAAVTAGVAFAVAVVLYPLSQLSYAWLQGPMRLLTADVIAIRERVDAIGTSPIGAQETELRQEAADAARLAQEQEVRRALRRVRDEASSLKLRATEESAKGPRWALYDWTYLPNTTEAARQEIAGYASMDEVLDLVGQTYRQADLINRQAKARENAVAATGPMPIPYGDVGVLNVLIGNATNAVREIDALLKRGDLLA